MLTKEQAIKECKDLWGEIEKSGLSKSDFFASDSGKVWRDRQYFMACPLCQYDITHRIAGKSCYSCPLVEQYDKTCGILGFNEYRKPSKRWIKAIKNLS